MRTCHWVHFLSPESGGRVFPCVSYEIRDRASLGDDWEVEKMSLKVGVYAWQKSLRFKGHEGTAVCFTASGSRYLELEILLLTDFPLLYVDNDFSYHKELREQ